MIRLAFLLSFALFLLLPTSLAAAECQFVLGFATLRDLIGHEIVGECLENEHYEANGDSLQQTTGGLLVWRKADNWTAFTDGYRSWINGPNGLEQRLNTQRFKWEADRPRLASIVPSSQPPTSAIAPARSLVELAQASAWYRDGVDYADKYQAEPGALRALATIDRNNPQLAGVISSWAWLFDDDVHVDEAAVIEYIAALDEKVPKFAPYMVGLPWIADGVDRWESAAASGLYVTAMFYDLDFAIELATAPWVVDGIVLLEVLFGTDPLVAMSGDTRYANSSPELARRALSFVNYPPREVDFYLVAALDGLNRLNPDGLARLLTEPWFMDGLNEEERVYLIAASSAGVDADELFEPYEIASARIALPHTGEVNLWVVGRHPFHAGQEALAHLEKAVRGSEQFWKLPFPVDDVILSLLTPTGPGRHLGRAMVLPEWMGLRPSIVYHETAHYYFNFGHIWLSEGGAEVTELYISNGGHIPKVAFPEGCRELGAHNLQAMIEVSHVPRSDVCWYSMGEHFLVVLRETMGDAAWWTALRALYLELGYEPLHNLLLALEEEFIYEVFMEHTPPHRHDAVRDVFRRLHGGPFVDQ